MYEADVNFCEVSFHSRQGEDVYQGEFYFFTIIEIKNRRQLGKSLIENSLVLAQKGDVKYAIERNMFYLLCLSLLNDLKKGEWTVFYRFKTFGWSEITEPMLLDGDELENFATIAEILKEILNKIVQEQ